MEPERVVKFVESLAETLDFLESRGVTYRDLKTEDIYLVGERTKLSDFGMATGVVDKWSGTPSYSTPEGLVGGEAGIRSEVFVLASLAYEMLSGEVAYEGEDAADIAYKIQTKSRDGDFPSFDEVIGEKLRKLGHDVGAIQAVLDKAWSFKPEDRYESANEFAQALAGAVAAEPNNEKVKSGKKGGWSRLRNLW